jgi:hypothetical protein
VTDPLETRIAQVLAEHEDISFDLGTPRRYTRHGGWNMACGCGFPLGDGGDEEEAYRNRRAHVAAEVAKALGREWNEAAAREDRAAMSIDPEPPGVTLRPFTPVEIEALDG